ncbi:MAG: AMP-binding protein [Pseudomonadota bacterium]
MTYAQLGERVAGCADALSALGVGHGDCVAALTHPGADFLVSFLAAGRLGAVWLGLNPKYTLAELETVLTDAGPKVVLCRAAWRDRDYESELSSLSSLGRKMDISSIEDLARREAPLPGHAIMAGPDDPALLVFTSGTTGRPKGALISHKSILNAAYVRLRAWGHENLRALLNLPINHVGGASDIVGPALLSGGTLICMENFSASRTAAIIDAEAITFLYQIPTQLQLMLAAPQTASARLDSLRRVCWSGARAPDDLVDALAARFPGCLGSDYSMTESVGPVALFGSDASVEVLKSAVGCPPPGRDVRLDETTSEILVRDDYLFSNYLDRPDATAATLHEGWLRTGDIGAFDDRGFLKLVGRVKDMFVSGGYNVYPAEIERVLESHPDVDMAALIPVADELWGEVGHAYIASEKGVDPSALKALCRLKLANYKLPKAFSVKPVLPMLPIGKVDKAALSKDSGGEAGRST